MAKNTKLWGGRFEGTVEDWVERFGASISFDQKLAKFDLIGSLAHVQMLGQTGILSLNESEKIQEGLKELLEELEAGQLDFDIANERYSHEYGSIADRKNWSPCREVTYSSFSK